MSEAEAPVYFFDTSALLKRYHDEIGSDMIESAFNTSEADRWISDISIIEVYSAFARLVRTGEVTPEDFQSAKLELDADIQEGRLRVVVLTGRDKSEAVRLIEQYGLAQSLRTLDALHVAVMKRIGPTRIQTIYCADQTLISVLRTEGFTVVDPETSSTQSNRE